MKISTANVHKKLHPISWMLSTLLAICPGCFLALVLGASQLGFAGVLIAWFPPFILALIGLSLLSYYLTYRFHRRKLPLIIAGIGAVLFIYSNYMLEFPEPFIQVAGILLFAIAALIDINTSYRLRNQCQIEVS